MQRCNVGRGMVWLACLVIGLLASSAMAQDVPFQGVVVEDHATVLAGGSRKFYVVTYLPKGTIVTVKEVIEGYNAISPPPGSFSYISKAFVDAKGDGKTGVVSADHAPVKAANVNGSADIWKVQVDLPKGAKVQIVGEDDSYYKIVTPPGVSVYLPPGTVRRLEIPSTPPTPAPVASPAVEENPTHSEASPPVPSEATHEPLAMATTQPQSSTAAPSNPETVSNPPPTPPAPQAENAATQPVKAKAKARKKRAKPHPAPVVTAEPSPSPSPSPSPAVAPPSQATTFVQAKAQTPMVQALEARLAAAQQLPLEKQPLDDLLAAYSAATMDPNLPLEDQRIVMTRILQLKRSQTLAATLKSLEEATEQAGGAAPMAVPAAASLPPSAYRPAHYDLVGQLLASGVYNGDSGPRLYRLVEPASERTLAYVEPGKFDPARFLGRIVGINGQSRYDPALKLSIIDVTRLEILESATTAPAAK